MSRLSDPHAADVLFAFAGGASTLSGSRIDLDKGTDVGWAPDPIKLSSILRAMRFRMELSTFPTAKKCLDRLAALAWPRTVALPQETPRLDTIEYREFPSFAAYYQAEIQPWLGKWQDLCEVYARYQKGEITQEQGAGEIQARVAAAALAEDNGDVQPEGRPKKTAGETASGMQLSQSERAGRKRISRSTQQRLDAIARKKPDLLQAVAAGMPVREAARLAGVEPKPDAGKQLRRWWAAASPEQRAEFEEFIAAWHRKDVA